MPMQEGTSSDPEDRLGAETSTHSTEDCSPLTCECLTLADGRRLWLYGRRDGQR